MVGKMANVLWLEGSFVETLKGWQSGWFYITEPRNPEWVAAPEFRSGPPTRLTSWKETGLSWGKKGELTGLQTCIQTLVDKKLKLVNVVQVMLIRLILPCQQQAFNLWEFDPAAPNSEQALRHDIRRCLEGAFQGRRGPRIRYRGSRIQHAESRSCGKLFLPFTGY